MAIACVHKYIMTEMVWKWIPKQRYTQLILRVFKSHWDVWEILENVLLRGFGDTDFIF